MSRTRMAPADLRALAREMRQIFPQRPFDSDLLKKLRSDNRQRFEAWQRRQLQPAAT